jgi:hypothetical protein
MGAKDFAGLITFRALDRPMTRVVRPHADERPP